MSRRLLARAGLVALITGSAITMPLAEVGGITLTGDRLLGLVAVTVALLLAIVGRLRWTGIHVALAVFTAVQIACSLLSAGAWPRGLQLATVYVLGFACFALTAAWAEPVTAQRWAARVWIAVGASVGLLGAAAALAANLLQTSVWGAGIAERTRTFSGDLLLFAGKATFVEWNLLCSFLLVPFSVALWNWGDRDGWDRRSWIGLGLLAAMVAGLVFGITRAAWLAMAGLVAFWVCTRRPRPSRVLALVAVTAVAFAVQASVVRLAKPAARPGSDAPLTRPETVARPGWWASSSLASRVLLPITRGYDWNMAGRASIGRATLQSWRERPLVGHGAGSTNRLSVVLDNGERIGNLWNGNVVLFVLHDSGILGLAVFLGLLAVVAREGWRGAHACPSPASASLAPPLLAAGMALLFCYQFTHALWIMYPYVYVGLLTAVLEPPDCLRPSAAIGSPSSRPPGRRGGRSPSALQGLDHPPPVL